MPNEPRECPEIIPSTAALVATEPFLVFLGSISIMRLPLQAASVLLVGLALAGCSNEPGSQQGKLDESLPVVTIKVPGMT